jgi:hypothetical protein
MDLGDRSVDGVTKFLLNEHHLDLNFIPLEKFD